MHANIWSEEYSGEQTIYKSRVRDWYNYDMYNAKQTYENFTVQHSNFITKTVLFPLVIK